eukprot:CAMPEP_0114331682 /NCGR_PEP_ID=MMETSP0101-20121206/2578_1 /TAXON_ID=38822 ORGANISM="Pteridomonas danica, Strain PT" /NCGR_SAMPLE_ID=MMETSP0101 /ASSEMBLY_ACC=CAM_ASM_000211 /LENGTH=165 /DNA_ID=CAMNT_0001462103 /DNA_START=110 /DNA_END=607 /DNA_ORIENTATION=+
MCSLSRPIHPVHQPTPHSEPTHDAPQWVGDIKALVFQAEEPMPINHPDANGEVSKVLKQRLIGGKSGIPGLVHLSMVDFGDGGFGGSEALGFPSHVHGTGFHEVFIVLEGKGVMELNGERTEILTHGHAVHIPPGVTHTGKALKEESGQSFRMLYFAILDDLVAV